MSDDLDEKRTGFFKSPSARRLAALIVTKSPTAPCGQSWRYQEQHTACLLAQLRSDTD